MKKNILLISFLLLSISVLANPIDTSAKELDCVYNYNNNELTYSITNNKVKIPFKDGDNFANKQIYSSADFSDSFIKSSNNMQVCPSLLIEENDLFITIFVNHKTDDNCNGQCTKVYNTVNQLSVTELKTGNAIGIYKSDAYFIPVFRLLSDGSKEWSINNKEFYPINEIINLDKNNIISIDSDYEKKIFTNDDNLDKIYRCVSQKGDKIIYKLGKDESICEDDLSKVDRQGLGSLSYNGSKGAGECQNTILGSPEEEDSVAWLLQKILDYLRILGPIIILVMSGIDFIKAILASDEETLQKSYKKLITRLILAIVLFFVPMLVELLLEIFGIMGDPICGLQ